MVVLKFGGTSVRNAEWILRAIDIAVAQLDQAPVVVSSAMTGITDGLLSMGALAKSGDAEGAAAEMERCAVRHREAAEAICPAALPELEKLLEEMRTLVHGVALIHDLSRRSSDALVSLGERMSTLLLARAAQARGIPTTLVDARELILTDDAFTSAVPNLPECYRRTAAIMHPEPGTLVVTQGFIGATTEGITTTLGRGGSDFSATIIGGALHAERVEIWTDVDGIMSADPRVVPTARTVDEMSYAEAAELAYFGAKVVHPATMVSAVERSIPVYVCNTGNPNGRRTLIGPQKNRQGICAIAGRRGVTIVTVHSSRMLNAYGFLSRMFAVFERHRVSVDIIATSEVSVSISVDQRELPPSLESALAELGQVVVERNKAVVSLVGQDYWTDARRVGAVFGALGAATAIDMVSLGSSDTNLTLVLNEPQLEQAVRALHRTFFEDVEG